MVCVQPNLQEQPEPVLTRAASQATSAGTVSVLFRELQQQLLINYVSEQIPGLPATTANSACQEQALTESLIIAIMIQLLANTNGLLMLQKLLQEPAREMMPEATSGSAVREERKSSQEEPTFAAVVFTGPTV